MNHHGDRMLRISAPIPGLGLFPGEYLIWQRRQEDQFVATRRVNIDRATFMALAGSPGIEVVGSWGPSLTLVKGGKK